MHFGNPHALWLLAAWPVLIALGWASLRWRDRMAGRLGSPQLLERLYPTTVRAWRRRRLRLGLAAAALLMIAAARPQYGRIERSFQSMGANVLIGLDTSRSMLAEDVAPSRLSAARASFAHFLHQLQGNRVGVMAFAGDATLNCPMTLDNAMALRILDALDTRTVGVPGTDLGRAIDLGADAFERGAGPGGRVLVLITDGEDLEERGIDAARRAAEKGVVVDAIGIGTARGVPVPDDQGGFVDDPAGGTVNTRLRMETLEEIARITGGVAIAAGDQPLAAINEVVRQIDRMEKAELDSRQLVVYQDRYPWVLIPALVLLIWMMLTRPEPMRLRLTRKTV